jgi:hypothetical protein
VENKDHLEILVQLPVQQVHLDRVDQMEMMAFLDFLEN